MNVFKSGWMSYSGFWTASGYANFKGRVSRREYWSFMLVYFLMILAVNLIEKAIGISLMPIWIGLHVIPVSCFQIRRLHDSGKSGVWVIVYALANYFGFFALLSNAISLINSQSWRFAPYVENMLFGYGGTSRIDYGFIREALFEIMGRLHFLFFLAIFWCIAVCALSVVIFVFTLLKGNSHSNKYDVGSESESFEKKDDEDAVEISVSPIAAASDYGIAGVDAELIVGGRKMKILRCEKCGKVICVLSDSANPDIYCCGVVMGELKANNVDAAIEKHVPVAEVDGKKVKVKIGEAAHPMTGEHYIDWIILEGSNNIQIANVKGKSEAVADFVLSDDENFVNAYAYCNLHGLWSMKK